MNKSVELVGSPCGAEHHEIRAREQAADLALTEELGVGAGDVVFFGEADDRGTDALEKG